VASHVSFSDRSALKNCFIGITQVFRYLAVISLDLQIANLGFLSIRLAVQLVELSRVIQNNSGLPSPARARFRLDGLPGGIGRQIERDRTGF
jgi:hypothetical protein